VPTAVRSALIVALSAIAAALFLIPAYQDSAPRMRMDEIVAAAGACREKVAAYAWERKRFPADAAQAGCTGGGSAHVAQVRVSGGRVEVVIRKANPSIDGRALVLEPMKDERATERAAAGDWIKSWRCSTTAGPGNFKYFPANCRQDPLPP
jgi:type IV pilus assembly protein PilA